MKFFIIPTAAALTLALSLGACSDPYDPGQRAVGGGLLGAGAGAAIGALTGGGRGAATGALIGGAAGAIGGAVTAPDRRPQYYEAPPTRYNEAPPPRYYDSPPGYHQSPGYYPSRRY